MDDSPQAASGTEPTSNSSQNSTFHPPPANDPFQRYRDAGPMDPGFRDDWDALVADGTPG